MTTISREVHILLSHPFCLPIGNAPVPRYDRKKRFDRLSRALGSKWHTFDISEVLPAVMKKRKDVVLVQDAVKDLDALESAINCSKRFAGAKNREILSVEQSSFYWDLGLGAVDTHIRMRLNSQDGMQGLYFWVEAFEEEMLAKDGYKPPGFKTWSALQNEYLRAFQETGMKTIKWLTNPEAPTFRLETCSWSVQMIQSAGDGIFMTKDTLEAVLVDFCGEVAPDSAFKTGQDELLAVHCGYSGNAAVVIDEEWTIHRVRWLWKTVALLYGSLLEAVEPVYDIVVDLLNDDMSSKRAGVGPGDIRTVQKVIDLLHNESNPVTICSESFDAMIYEKIWKSWGGADIEALVDARTSFLQQTLQDLSNQKTNNLQQRLNLVVFVLTIVSIAATVAAIIALLDLTNSIDATARAVIVGVLTGVIGLACLMVIITDFHSMLKRRQLIGKDKQLHEAANHFTSVLDATEVEDHGNGKVSLVVKQQEED